MIRYITLILATALCPAPAPAKAQEAVPEYQLTEPADILPLRRGAAAPRDGLLIDASDFLQIRADYERLRYLLAHTVERDGELCGVRVQIEQARTEACGERVTLRDELWTARQAELNQALVAAETRAARAAERGLLESPALWAVVGAAIVGALWIAVSVN